MMPINKSLARSDKSSTRANATKEDARNPRPQVQEEILPALQASRKKLAPCPKELTKRCKCCDQCRKECWVDAKS
jgi:hypothetical protein